jgi:hypothetical protein
VWAWGSTKRAPGLSPGPLASDARPVGISNVATDESDGLHPWIGRNRSAEAATEGRRGIRLECRPQGLVPGRNTLYMKFGGEFGHGVIEGEAVKLATGIRITYQR